MREPTAAEAAWLEFSDKLCALALAILAEPDIPAGLVLSTQCLDRRIADKQTLTEEVLAWEDNRNSKHAKADWQFTTADARIKLKRLYPAL